ncbi:hypothetical protein OEA41_009287 [Lepraria neglecta]|uniref:Uncharacterized protein n=1 Tax=Lepraria neglecta TaxID=209136 RepID=A0AAE0DK23_9LECA|nr:hypothetical protein OEA41_009287 [Lepraria neglecta]
MQLVSLLLVFAILYGSILGQYCASTTSQPFELIDLQTQNTTAGEDGLGASISFTLNDLNGPGLQTTCGYGSPNLALVDDNFHPCEDPTAFFMYPANETIVIERLLACGE